MLLGNRPTNPGELRTPVEFVRRTMTHQAGGFQTATVEVIAAARVRWTNVHGAEVWAAAATAGRAATLLARFLADVDNTCLVRLDGQLWEIVSIDNIQQRSEYMEIKVKQAVAG